MHILIALLIIAATIWAAIEFPHFRKALAITGICFAVFCVWIAWFVTSHHAS